MGRPPSRTLRYGCLRWKQFIQAEFDSFVANTKKFSEQTGVKVRVDAENWDDIRPKAAVAANVGAGPDIIIGTNDDPFKFADKLIDVTDVAEYLGAKYGGWYPIARTYGMLGKKWIALPQGATGGTMNYRINSMRAAGFDEFPKDLAGYLKLCQGLKRVGKPPGFALGHATGDANGWVYWCLWAHGGKMVDDNNNVAIDSPETIAALEYAKQLYPTFIDGVLSWNDASNNKAFLADQIGLTLNGISIYTVAKNSPEPALNAIAKDMDHANMPIGPVGRPTEEQNIVTAYSYAYSKYPNAVREYLRFMWEKPQVDRWETASNGYVAPPLPAWNDNPVWTADPKVTPFRDVLKYALDIGYSGHARLCLGGGDGRLRLRRHVRRGLHRRADAEGRRAARRRARQALLQGLMGQADTETRRPATLRRSAPWRRTSGPPAGLRRAGADRLRAFSTDRNFLGLVFMLPAAAILLVFLAYPLGLGLWLGLTDTPIGEPGRFIGLANFISLAHDSVFWLVGVQHLVLHGRRELPEILPRPLSRAAAQPAAAVQVAASRHRAVAVRRADRALGDRLLVDLRSAILDRLLGADQVRHSSTNYIDFLGQPWHARWSRDRRQRLARHSFRRHHAARRTADDLALAARSGDARRRQPVAAIPLRHACRCCRRSSPS